jgi:hypothetical protein
MRLSGTIRLIASAGVLAVAALALGQAADKADKKPAAKTVKRPVYREDEVLRQVDVLWPEMHARLVAAKVDDPKDYQDRMDRIGPVVERYLQLKPNNPGLAALILESFQLGEECRDLARLYHMAPDDAGRARCADLLRAKVSEQIEVEFKRQQSELADLEKRLGQMRKQLADQQAKRDRLVEDRVKKWVGKAPPKAPPAKGAQVAPDKN